MYAINGGSIAEVTFEMHVNGQLCMSVFHYWLSEEYDLTDGRQGLLDLLGVLNNPGKLLDCYQGLISDTIIDIEAYAQWIWPDRYRYVRDPGGPYAGAVAFAPLPQNLSIAISKQAEEATRHGQGTLHLPGIAEGYIANGEVNQLIAGGDLDDLCAEIPVGVVLPGGQEMDPVLFNRAAPDESLYIATADWEVSSRVMRRRTKGVGA